MKFHGLKTGARALLASLLLSASASALAALQIVNNDGAGEGFNDTTVASAVGGNTATTLGAQRLAVFNKAADILNQAFSISQTIQVDAQFNPLSCTTNSATLGSAGPKYSYSANESGVWTVYPISLANEHFATDLVAGDQEIQATFNSEIGKTGCLESSSWYLGFDSPSSGTSLLSVVLHELMHGMGFLSFMGSDGSAPATVSGSGEEIYDPYTKLLYDATQAALVTTLSQSARASSELNTGNLLWDGSQVNSNIGGLSAGVNGSRVRMYAPSSYESGSSVSHFDTALTPNEVMEPQYTEFLDDPGLAKYLLADIGWTLQASSNSAPVFSAVPDQTLDEDSSKTVTLAATDSDGDSLTYSLTSAPAELGVSLSGTTLTIAPQANYSGTGTVIVGVTDDQASDSDSFSVTVNAVNDAPVLAAIGNQTVAEDNTISITLAATDVDSGSLTYSLVSAPTELGASVTGTTLTITPIANYAGSGNIEVSVSDTQLSDSETFQVTVTAVNDAPVFTVNTSYNMVIGDNQNITLTATDAENDALTFTLDSFDNAAVSASLSGSTLSVTAVAAGSTAINVSVSDGSLSDTETLSFNITATPNNAPVWSAPSSITLMAGGDAAEQTLSASDADSDSLSYSVTSVPTGLSATVTDTTLSVSASASATAGSYVLSLQVTDGIDPVSTTVSVTVVPELTLTSGDSALTDGDTFTVSNEATIFTLAGGDNSLTTSLFFGGSNRDDLISSDVSGNFTLAMPDAGAFAGVYTLTVTDGNGFTASYYFERPLRLVPAVSPLMIHDPAIQTMKIEGAPATTSIALSSDTAGLGFADNQGIALTEISAPDDADNFNAALVYLALDTTASADFSATITAQASNIPDSVRTLDVQLPRTLTVTVQDTAGSSIDNAIVSVYDERFSIWGFDDAVTASNGQASILLPNEAITLYTDASGYLEKETQLNSTQTQATVTLTSSATAFTLSGIIQSSGFNFSEELPVIELYFTDGSKETLSAEQISVSSVRYRWDGDLDQQLPDYLRVSHSLGSTIDTDVVTAYATQTINITLINNDNAGTTTVVVSSSGGGGAMAEILLVLLSVLMLTSVYSTDRRTSVLNRERTD